MSRHPLMRPKLLFPLLTTLGLVVFLGTAFPPGHASAPALAEEETHHVHGGAPMTDAEMERWVEDWFSKHPEVGRQTRTAAVADTFFVLAIPSNIFNSDNNTSTVVDTAKIFVGEAVLWRWVSGSHTITSGTGPTDPQVGALFDVPSTSVAPTFQFTYNTTGTFPFFCRPHVSVGFNMRGIVVVRSVVDVGPYDGQAIGFISGPTPNPSRNGMRFRFALREAGPVHAEVVDVSGRRVATVLDQRFEPGTYAGAWNGLEAKGTRAGAGAYYLRLKVPGSSSTRRFVVTP